MDMRGPKPTARHAKPSHSPTHLSLGKDLVLIIRLIELHRLDQLRLFELLRVLRPHRTRPNYANVPVDFFLVAYQSGGLVGRQARLSVESACIAVDVVIPLIGARMVIELASFDRAFPAEMSFELALFCDLVAKIGKVEGLDLVGDVVEDGRVWVLRRGAEDIAIGFWGAGLAVCFTGPFVGAPVDLLTVLAAIVGALASATFARAWFRTGGVGADLGHDGN